MLRWIKRIAIALVLVIVALVLVWIFYALVVVREHRRLTEGSPADAAP